MIVTKYVAHFNYKGNLELVKAKFRETPKLYILAEDNARHPIRSALSWGTRFAQDDWRLSDSPEASLVTLFQREERALERASEKVEAAKARMRLITEKQAEYVLGGGE